MIYVGLASSLGGVIRERSNRVDVVKGRDANKT